MRIRGVVGLVGMLVSHAGLASAQDSDGDGVSNLVDGLPCDPGASGLAYAPADGIHEALLFEDQWPRQGDLDFNDLVLTYNYAFRTNAAGRVVSMRATYNAIAVGGMLHNGLGLTLPVARSAVASVTRTVGGAAPEVLTPSPDAQLTVALSTDLRELFGHATSPINCKPGDPRLDGSMLVVDVQMAAPVNMNIGAAPFDVFTFRSNSTGHEIHLPQYAGSAAMNQSLFGTADDGSTETTHFVDVAGLPFALAIPTSANYPLESTTISALFPDILAFAASGGTQNADFYQTNVVTGVAYRDVQGLPPLAPKAGPPYSVDRSCVPPVAVQSYVHLDFFTVAEGGLVDSYQVTDLAVDWDRDRAYFLRSNNDPAQAILRSFHPSTMVEDQQARMSSVSAVSPNNFPGTLHSDGDGYLYLITGSSNSRPVLRIDASSYTEVGRFGISSSGLSNTLTRLVATTWMATMRSGGENYLLTGSIFDDIAVIRTNDMTMVWGVGQTVLESRVRGVAAGGPAEGWILGSNTGTSHTGLALYQVNVGPVTGATRVATFAPSQIEPGATTFYDMAGGLTYDATDGGVIFQIRVGNGGSAGNIHTLKWRGGAIVWNVVTPFMINYEGPFESQNRLTQPRFAQMRGSRLLQWDTRTGARMLDTTLPFNEGGAQTYDSESNRLIVRTSAGWTRIQLQ